MQSIDFNCQAIYKNAMFEKKTIFLIKRYVSKTFTRLQKICSGFARIEIVDSYKNLHAHLGDTIKITLDTEHIPPIGKKVYRALLLTTTNDLVEDYGYRFTRDRSR